MSLVKNPHSYDTLRTINVLEPSNDFKLKYIGMFDERFGFETEPTYKPFAFEQHVDGKILFNDEYLEGNSCAYTYFKHRFFGAGKLSRYTSKGHYHTKCYVSDNEVNLLDCSFKNARGDLYFFADIVEGMPIIYDNYSFMLYVLKPTLSKEELSALALNSKTVFEWKHRLLKSKTEIARAHAQEVIAVSIMGEAVVKASMYKDHIDTLTTLLTQSNDKMLEVTGKGFDVVLDAVNMIEEKYDLGILGDESLKKGMNRFLSGQRMELKFVEALTNAELDGSEGLKRQIFNTALGFIGLDKMKEYLNMTSSSVNTEVTTPAVAMTSAIDKLNLKNLSKKEQAITFKNLMNHFKSGLPKSGNDDFSDEEINNSVLKSLHELQTGNALIETEAVE